jgi:dTDP-4-amino-4,6-dideoxygalactose transaminase
LAQLESIEENLSERRICWERYWNRLFPLAEAGHFTLPDIPPECEINWHMFFLQANSSAEADSLRDHLNRKGVQAVIHYVPLHVSIMGEKLGYKPADLQVTNEYASRLLRLPFHNSLTSEEIDSICEVIEDFFT